MNLRKPLGNIEEQELEDESSLMDDEQSKDNEKEGIDEFDEENDGSLDN